MTLSCLPPQGHSWGLVGRMKEYNEGGQPDLEVSHPRNSIHVVSTSCATLPEGQCTLYGGEDAGGRAGRVGGVAGYVGVAVGAGARHQDGQGWGGGGGGGRHDCAH